MKSDLSIPEADVYALDTLAKIRRNLGADLVLLGAYAVLGGPRSGRVRLEVRLQDARNGEVVATESGTGARAKIFDLVSQTGARMREKLGLQAVTPAQAEEVRAALPSNPEAARLYAEGLAKLRTFDAPAARDLLQKTITADPGYALGHAALAEAWSALGYDQKAIDEASEAFDLSAGLSSEERLSIEGRYREMTKAWPRMGEIYQRLFAAFPDNVEYGLRLAEAQTFGGKTKEALKTIEALRRSPPPLRDDPRIDLAEARAAKSLGDFRRERSLAASAAAQAEARGARLQVAAALREQAGAADDLGDSKQAIELNEKAKTIYAGAGDRRGAAAALNDLGNILLHQGDPAGAKRAYDAALAASRDTGDLRGATNALANLAILLYRQGDLAGAIQTFRNGLSIEREIGDKNAVAIFLNNIGSILADRGDLLGARRSLEESLKIARAVSDQSSEARTLYNLAHLWARQGRLAKARVLDEESVVISRQIDDRRELAYALHGLGDVLLSQADLAQSRKTLEEALAIRTAMGDKGTAAESRLYLAQVSLEEGNAAQGAEGARECAKEFRTENDGDEEAFAHAILARCLLAEGKLLEAQKEVERSVGMASTIEDRELRLAVAIDSARVRVETGEAPRAVKDLRLVLDAAKKYGYSGTELEASLVLGEAEMKAGHPAAGRRDLAALAQEAKAKGFGLIARKAASARLQAGPFLVEKRNQP